MPLASSDMDIAVKQFYERFIDSLIEAEKRSEDDYELVKERFFAQLEEHLDHAQRLNDIVADLKSVSQRLFFIDDRIRERAQNAYKDVPEQFDKMKELLVEAYESMFLSIKNENYRDACKFVVIQAEIISEYLIINHDIINNWIKKEPILIEKYSLQSPDSNQSFLKAKSKLIAVSDYSGHSWDASKFKIVNDIRNYGSHGYHESVLAKHESDVNTISIEYKDFFVEWFNFIKTSAKKLYSFEKSSEYDPAQYVKRFKGKLSIPKDKSFGYVNRINIDGMFVKSIFIDAKVIKLNNWKSGDEIEGEVILNTNSNTGAESWKLVTRGS